MIQIELPVLLPLGEAFVQISQRAVRVQDSKLEESFRIFLVSVGKSHVDLEHGEDPVNSQVGPVVQGTEAFHDPAPLLATPDGSVIDGSLGLPSVLVAPVQFGFMQNREIW